MSPLRRAEDEMMEGRWIFVLLFVASSVACGDEGEERSAFAITALSREDHTDLFPIVEGVHAGSDCNDCHGGFESFSELTCVRGCHDGTGHPEASTAQRHDGIPGYVWDTGACLACHPEGR